MVDKLSGQVELIEVSSRRGRSATIAIGTITTGAAGTNASVTNVGTSGEAVFNFTIPMGDAVELRINGGYLQWKNTTAATWTNILEIADITATIEVGTVTTGDADSSVTFTNVGSGKDAIFNLSIPKGTTFTPSVSAEGVISFTNDGGLDNPTSVNIKGVQGDPAPNTIWQYSADNTTWTTSVPDGVRFMRESTDNGTTWSTAIELPTVAALALKAPLASPTFTGDVIVPDQTAGNNSTKAANTKYVDTGLGLKADLTYTEYLMMEGDPA